MRPGTARPDLLVVVDRQERVTALTPEAARYLGWAEREVLGEPFSRFVANGGPPHSSGAFVRRRDGSERPVELSRLPLGRGDDAQSLVTLRDLVPWAPHRHEASPNNEQARAALASIGDAVITTDTAGMITYLNQPAEHLTGWTATEAVGQSLDAVMPLVFESSRHPVSNMATRCLEEGRSIDLEDGVVLVRRDGTEVPVGDSTSPLRDRHGGTVGVILVIQDEREKRRIGQQLSFEATHDSLTGLINRREFDRRLARVATDPGGDGGEHVVLYIDLDGFKAVNDICGHIAGDELLRSLAELLHHKVRQRDTLARIGGDEFGVLLERCPMAEALRIAEGLRQAVESYRLEWDGKTCSVGASIGLIPVMVTSGGGQAMLQAADAACYAAKRAGGNRVHSEPLPGSAWANSRRPLPGETPGP